MIQKMVFGLAKKKRIGSSMIVPHSRPTIDQDDISAVAHVLASGRIAQGKKAKEFEAEMANLIGVRHAVACSSGTAAIHLALLGLETKPENEVLMPSYVCASPYFATLHAGAKPKIADIDRTEYNISAKTARDVLSSKTKAIIVPHMFGNPAELDELFDLGIPVIEDCAQSIGAEYKNRKVGSFGELSVFSFYATKLVTTGEGGMVLTNSRELYSRIAEARDYDMKPLARVRYNYKMTDLQAALGLSQLKKLQNFISRRKQIASLYNERLSKYVIAVPNSYSHKESAYFRYVVLVNRPEELCRSAKRKGIFCEKPVWKPLHRSLTFVRCPMTDYVHQHALSIPIYPSLRQKEIDYVVETLKDVFGTTSRIDGARCYQYGNNS
jgi:perosamine synthetase